MSGAGAAGVAAAGEVYFAALRDADEDAAVGAALGLLAGGLSVPQVLASLVVPAQRRVGACWEGGRWDVAREHAATHISDRVVAALGARLPEVPRRGRVVLACVDGEWHALAARIVGETLRAGGWRVTFLGASTPAARLGEYVREVGPDAVALSCSVAAWLPTARTMVRAARGVAVPVLAGGPGFGPDGRWARALGANAWARDAAHAVELLGGGWPHYAEPAPPLAVPDDEFERFGARRALLAERLRGALCGEGPAALGEGFGRLPGFLAAALLVDDEEVLVAQVRWLAGMLAARGVEPRAVGAALARAAGLLEGFPRARRMLAAARADVGG
ncbi:cobalamin B12-binding domain-containing protein [Actinomadura parmotrematis]|uniref:Cobalamin-dependent protein n=1 Tax=Actinomadura parmotrematis TaxID=2864039 RepID=A0ABS7FQS0_9ACTN|nr:cobalamin-dependent protein [Actinomadura parmotrematis]MBW8482736.1 cobalamin-dependent protein [Actinomadura parmotrematis]